MSQCPGSELVQGKQGSIPIKKEATVCLHCFPQHSDWWKTRSHSEEKRPTRAYCSPLNINTLVRQMRLQPPFTRLCSKLQRPQCSEREGRRRKVSVFSPLSAKSPKPPDSDDEWSETMINDAQVALNSFFLKCFFQWIPKHSSVCFSLSISSCTNNSTCGLSMERSSATVYHNSLIPGLVCYDNVPRAFMELTPSRGTEMSRCCIRGSWQLETLLQYHQMIQKFIGEEKAKKKKCLD